MILGHNSAMFFGASPSGGGSGSTYTITVGTDGFEHGVYANGYFGSLSPNDGKINHFIWYRSSWEGYARLICAQPFKVISCWLPSFVGQTGQYDETYYLNYPEGNTSAAPISGTTTLILEWL